MSTAAYEGSKEFVRNFHQIVLAHDLKEENPDLFNETLENVVAKKY